MVTMSNRLIGRTENKFIALKNGVNQGSGVLPLIDLGAGEPPVTASAKTFACLAEEVRKPQHRFYADNGVEQFRKAAKEYFCGSFSPVSSELDVLPIPGIKSTLAMLPAAFTNFGDVCLMPEPAYPVLGTWTEYMGGSVYRMPLVKSNSFYPDLDAVPVKVLNRAKLMYLNYPNNPTGQCASADFWADVVRFALKWGILIIHDAAYSEIIRPDIRRSSIFNVPGAEACCLELHSLSKIRNMTGWRIGFAVGSESLTGPLRMVKSNTDSGQFIPIQLAAAAALGDTADINRLNRIYTERLKSFSALLHDHGFESKIPDGTFYLYAGISNELMQLFAVQCADEFAFKLRASASVLAVPWGNAHIRFSMTYPITDEGDEWLCEEIRCRFEKAGL